MGFQRSGFKRFGQALKAGLCDRGGGCVAHGGVFLKKKAAFRVPRKTVEVCRVGLILPSRPVLSSLEPGFAFLLVLSRSG
jgi:hypothetical protein